MRAPVVQVCHHAPGVAQLCALAGGVRPQPEERRYPVDRRAMKASVIRACHRAPGVAQPGALWRCPTQPVNRRAMKARRTSLGERIGQRATRRRSGHQAWTVLKFWPRTSGPHFVHHAHMMHARNRPRGIRIMAGIPEGIPWLFCV
eukprot:191277-Chlamydomonas_euryale.AAC.3